MVLSDNDASIVQISRTGAGSAIVLICEHASPHVPPAFNDLGISPAARNSHAAWDPGAMSVAQGMSEALDAVLVSTTVSRLVYDCNRPPTAPDAMPTRSETFDVPGNVGLSDDARQDRIERYYAPFRDRLTAEVARRTDPIIVTIHSFTPVYHGQVRDLEIGILHDSDSRLADAMLRVAPDFDVRRNAPYGPEDGVTHTLLEHAVRHGHLNVMIEIRNDLIADDAAQAAMARTLTGWLTKALQSLEAAACKA